MRTVAITGSSGYVGSELAGRFERDGWSVTRFSRSGGVLFHLGDEVMPDAFKSPNIDALVHCAYDFAPLTWSEIHRVNVEGSRRLIAAAGAAGVGKIVVISTISAFPGCRSLYGRAKLEIEKDAITAGGMVVRPGMVYGHVDTQDGGMMGNLRRSASGRIVPLLDGGRQLQYLIHVDDLFGLVQGLCTGELGPISKPVVAASPRAWTVRALIEDLARRQHVKPRFVPVPWRMAWFGLKAAETVGLRPAYRSDSVISLINQDPNPDFAPLRELGVSVRDFG